MESGKLYVKLFQEVFRQGDGKIQSIGRKCCLFLDKERKEQAAYDETNEIFSGGGPLQEFY